MNIQQLEAGLVDVLDSPRDAGVLKLIVRRPDVDAREVTPSAELDVNEGLIGDNWKVRGSSITPDRSAHPDMQINIMNARVAALVAGERERWPLAGDQLYVDLDLSDANLPPGTRLAIGEAVLEVTAMPHTGCRKFRDRFGPDALQFVNSGQGRALNLRGINAKVVRSGRIEVNDTVSVLSRLSGVHPDPDAPARGRA